jgi:hypothetical protein
MTVPLRFNKQGQPEPMGVRAAAAKMAEWIATTDKKADLTAEEGRLVAAVAEFFADEYTRISTANEQMERDIRELRAQIIQLEDRVRELGAGGLATDGGAE